MKVTVDQQPGEDMGQLNVTLESDDDMYVAADMRGVTLTLPLYSHQARQLRKALQPLARTKDAA